MDGFTARVGKWEHFTVFTIPSPDLMRIVFTFGLRLGIWTIRFVQERTCLL
jgi:hypothetical protein